MTGQDSGLKSLQQSYQMAPAAYLPELPDSGISLSRWQRRETGVSHVIEHRLPCYTLSLILHPMRARAWLGSARVWDGAISQYSIRLTPPDVDPRWQADGAFDFLLLTIPTQTVARIAGEETLRHVCDLRRARPLYIRDDVVLQIGRGMLDACLSQRPYAAQFADGLGAALVAHLLSSYSAEPSSSNRLALSSAKLRRVTEYIATHLSEELRVESLSAVAGLSASRFAHAFRASVGVAPHAFITSARIEKAQELLRSGHRPIAEIALECGFKDPSHFSRVFRASSGATPQEFRSRAGQKSY
jgi:AraC family transcriptional regulator